MSQILAMDFEFLQFLSVILDFCPKALGRCITDVYLTCPFSSLGSPQQAGTSKETNATPGNLIVLRSLLVIPRT